MFEHFTGWCHKVIPLVYDDALSYYEMLGKLMYKINELITGINTINGNAVFKVNNTAPTEGNVNVGTVKSVNGTTPDADGNVNLSSVSGVTSVNGIGADGSGNVELTAANVGAIPNQDNAIIDSMIAEKTIKSRSIEDGAITATKLGVNSVFNTNLAAGAVTASKISNKAIDSTKISDKTILEGNIADGTITETLLADFCVNTRSIIDKAVSAAKVADDVRFAPLKFANDGDVLAVEDGFRQVWVDGSKVLFLNPTVLETAPVGWWAEIYCMGENVTMQTVGTGYSYPNYTTHSYLEEQVTYKLQNLASYKITKMSGTFYAFETTGTMTKT